MKYIALICEGATQTQTERTRQINRTLHGAESFSYIAVSMKSYPPSFLLASYSLGGHYHPAMREVRTEESLRYQQAECSHEPTKSLVLRFDLIPFLDDSMDEEDNLQQSRAYMAPWL